MIRYNSPGYNPHFGAYQPIRPEGTPMGKIIPPRGGTGARIMCLKPVESDTSWFTGSKFSLSIYCCDCGIEAGIGNADVPPKPKDVARAHGWEHAGKGKWRCSECAAGMGKGEKIEL
jgi:hypothetical protein